MKVNPVERVRPIGSRGARDMSSIQTTHPDIAAVALDALDNNDPRIKDALELNAPGLYSDIFENHLPKARQANRVSKAIDNNGRLRQYIEKNFPEELKKYQGD